MSRFWIRMLCVLVVIALFSAGCDLLEPVRDHYGVRGMNPQWIP